jgi:hypothetical protein
MRGCRSSEPRISGMELALGIGGVASLDDDIEDQAALAGSQVELVSVLNLADLTTFCPRRFTGLEWRSAGPGVPV